MKKLSKCQGNTKISWQLMKEITGKIKKKKKNFPKALKISKKSSSLAKNIPPASSRCTEHLMSFNDALSDSDFTI